MLTTLIVLAVVFAGFFVVSKGLFDPVPVDPPIAETVFYDDLIAKLQALREDKDWRLVGIFGDDARLAVLNDLADSQDANVTKFKGTQYSVCSKTKLALICIEEEEVMRHAIVASQVDVALIVSDATIGLLPLVREHILLVANHRVPLVIPFLARSHLVHDADLLELEELEIREVMTLYLLPGEDAVVAHSSTSSPVPAVIGLIKGAQATLELASKSDLRPVVAPSPPMVNAMLDLYALGHSESFSIDVGVGVVMGLANAVIGNKFCVVQLVGNAHIPEATHGTFRVSIHREHLNLPHDELVVIVQKGHISGIGRISFPN